MASGTEKKKQEIIFHYIRAIGTNYFKNFYGRYYKIFDARIPGGSMEEHFD
jgi:hypothetical protein